MSSDSVSHFVTLLDAVSVVYCRVLVHVVVLSVLLVCFCSSIVEIAGQVNTEVFVSVE